MGEEGKVEELDEIRGRDRGKRVAVMEETTSNIAWLGHRGREKEGEVLVRQKERSRIEELNNG